MLTHHHTLNCNGRLVSLSKPKIMGILNLTPDSFSDGGLYDTLPAALAHTEKMLKEGADIIDIGGYSTRPSGEAISVGEELRRVEAITQNLLRTFPDALFSIDTFRSAVAERLLDMGIHIVNDISGGTLDPRMMEVVGRYPTPYIIMHIQGTPQTMQESPTYTDIVVEVRDYLIHQVNTARNAGIKDIIIDLGFGFGKTISHNYTLFEHLPYFAQMGLPVLVGISRKSMIYKLLDISPLETLPYTTALHLQALYYGAKILRVHEIKEAVHTVRLFEQLQST